MQKTPVGRLRNAHTRNMASACSLRSGILQPPYVVCRVQAKEAANMPAAHVHRHLARLAPCKCSITLSLQAYKILMLEPPVRIVNKLSVPAGSLGKSRRLQISDVCAFPTKVLLSINGREDRVSLDHQRPTLGHLIVHVFILSKVCILWTRLLTGLWRGWQGSFASCFRTCLEQQVPCGGSRALPVEWRGTFAARPAQQGCDGFSWGSERRRWLEPRLSLRISTTQRWAQLRCLSAVPLRNTGIHRISQI